MGFGLTRRSFLKTAAAGALAAGGLGEPRTVAGQAKPGKLNVLQEDFEPLSSWVAKRFQQKHGIEVAFTTTEFTPNYEKQIADMISGSATSLYDVVVWSDPFTGVFAPKGYYEPLDAYLARSTALKLDDIKGPWVPAATWKGKLYGLPFHNLDMQLFYRKDLIPQAPRTYQEILEWAKKVSRSPQFYGFTGDWDDDNFWYNFRRRLFAAGGRMWDREGNPAFQGDAGVRALQWFRDMWGAGVVFPETLRTFSGGVNNKVMAAGKAAMSFNWSWANLTFEDPKLSVISGKYGMALNPADADDPEKKYSCAAPVAEGLGSIPVRSANKEWGWKFIEEYLSRDAQLFCVKELGLTPVRHDVFNDPETTKWPIFALNREQLDRYPSDEIHSLSPYGVDFVVIRAFSEHFHSAIQGKVPVKDALNRAADVVAKAIARAKRRA
ncbi:MAG: extracellular solute-binding protein [Candidatus Rokubacteria bacterium]|nr:extracellular solute-binding protein [Candidatus Rokubacteria bacterium]